MTRNLNPSYGVWIADPDYPTHTLRPNLDGSINVAGGSSTNPNANPTTIKSAGFTATTTPSPLSAEVSVNGWILVAGSSATGDPNSAPIWVGGSNMTNTAGVIANGYPVPPGGSISYGVANRSAIYIVSATVTGQVIYATGN